MPLLSSGRPIDRCVAVEYTTVARVCTDARHPGEMSMARVLFRVWCIPTCEARPTASSHRCC